jgi:NTP pyrophosphatase (non-canonical NTP hydrolase)
MLNLNRRLRKILKIHFSDEMADALIRILDMCGGLDIDIEKHVELKLRYNSLRPKLHGKLY